MKKVNWLAVLVVATLAWGTVPGDLAHDDGVVKALFHKEPFHEQQAHVPNTPSLAKQKLLELLASQPSNEMAYKALSRVELEFGNLVEAENSMKKYVEVSKDKDAAYKDLELFYRDRLQFQKQFEAMQAHAQLMKPSPRDVGEVAGKYAMYKRILKHIENYGLDADPRIYYRAAIDSYPEEKKPYFDYFEFLKEHDKAGAQSLLEEFARKFPEDQTSHIRKRIELLEPEEAFVFLNTNYSPAWDLEVLRTFDQVSIRTGRKGEYLADLRAKLKQNPLDFKSNARLFHSYFASGNITDAQNALNDFRLLKERQRAAWTAEELFRFAEFQRILSNHNEAARYYYALYSHLLNQSSTDYRPDSALHGLFQVVLAAGTRPVQLAAGSLDYYRDIATADQSPGILNGILSLILNGEDPRMEFAHQQEKAIEYYNYAEAYRLLRFTARSYPQSPHLPTMYRDSLKIFERYAMNELIVSAGEEYFRRFHDSKEILEVGIAVADAYGRMKNYQKEWATYESILPIAAKRARGRLVAPGREADDSYREDSESDEMRPTPQSSPGPQINYESLLNRYIASLTAQKQHLAVVQLYQKQIASHPDEETLYENFAAYLSQNQLFAEEELLYRRAIEQFPGTGWYEKLARWYLRRKRDSEYVELSRMVMDVFRGTEVESYLEKNQDLMSNQLSLSLNQHAHDRFPLNLVFVKNILDHYAVARNWEAWLRLSAEYYFLDESIRNAYLFKLAQTGTFPPPQNDNSPIQQRYAGDLLIWKSHFEEALTTFESVTASYPTDRELNLLVADLKRSLALQNASNANDSAAIRVRLAQIEPADAALWTVAGETLAEQSQYERAKQLWAEILKIGPRDPDRYLEVATILWDYYLFDDALSVLYKFREIRQEPERFAYEAGAILESKRDYPAAIAEYAKSLISTEELARNRLTELYKREKYSQLVRAHLEKQLQNNKNEAKWWLGVLRFYAAQNDKEQARYVVERALATADREIVRELGEELKQTAFRFAFYDLHEKVLKTQIEIAESDLDKINKRLELARFYESRKMPDAAENLYRALYRDQPKSAGFIQELVSYYWRHEKYHEAFRLYQEAISVANVQYRKKYMLEMAEKYRERKDLAAALSTAHQLFSENPDNPQYFQLVAEILALKGDYPSLTAHYTAGLKRIHESDAAEEDKKQKVFTLRRAIIQANVLRKDYSAAVDQYIEILNRDAESEELVNEIARFASKYGMFQRLLDYYNKTAEASPKDHRWPMILGRLALYSGDFQSAITSFQKAISSHPERTDLYEKLASTYQRLGQYPEALQTYEKLYSLTFKDKRWLTPMAELHARLGKYDKALSFYKQTLTSLPAIEQDFAMCRQALSWGRMNEAVQHGEAGMKKFLAKPSEPLDAFGLESYLEALTRSGKSLRALKLLQSTWALVDRSYKNATFDSENLRASQYALREAFSRVFPSFVRKYLTGNDLRALDTALMQELKLLRVKSNVFRELYLPLVRAAGMAPAEEKILQALADLYFAGISRQDDANWHQYRNSKNELARFYRERHQFSKGADYLWQEWKRNPRRPSTFSDLIEIAELYRMAGTPEGELRALREYYDFGLKHSLQPEPVERYLSLLYSNAAQQELKEAAVKANLISANFFVSRKDSQLAITAIESLHKILKQSKQPEWENINLAMLGWQFRDPGKFYDHRFVRGLALYPIGEMLDSKHDRADSVEGDLWFHYALKYGEYRWRTGNKEEAAHFLPSDLEGMPSNASRQFHLADFYKKENDSAQALEHVRLALHLAPRNIVYGDFEARILMSQGQTEAALKIWKELLQNGSTNTGNRLWEMIAKAYEDYRLKELKPELEEFLLKRVQQSGIAGLGTILPSYLKTLPSDEQKAITRVWITSAPAPKDFGQALLGMKALSDDASLMVYEIVSDYLKTRFSVAGGQELQMLLTERANWTRRHANELIRRNQFQQGLRIVRDLQKEMQVAENDSGQSDTDLLLLEAKLLLLNGDKQSATRILTEYAEDLDAQDTREERYRQAYEVLKLDAKLGQEWLERMYEALILSGQVQSANYIGLAEVKLERNGFAEAEKVLREMIYLRSEDLEALHLAAELLEKRRLYPQAVEYRKELVKRMPWNLKNKAMLAEDLLRVDLKKEAASFADEVIKTPAAEASDRARAAKVYANSSASQAGTGEMLAIQTLVRNPQSSKLLDPYYFEYYQTWREIVETPPLPPLIRLLSREPEDQELQLQIFNRYYDSGRCYALLQVLDPDKRRHDPYAVRPDNQDSAESGRDYYYGDYNYPVENLKLSEDATATLATRMAHCAEQLEDYGGQLFFLKMAAHHSPAKELQTRIEETEKRLALIEEAESNRFRVTLNLGRQE